VGVDELGKSIQVGKWETKASALAALVLARLLVEKQLELLVLIRLQAQVLLL
jgi:hypothetical protein